MSYYDDDSSGFRREMTSVKLSRQFNGESDETVEKTPAPPPQIPQKLRKNSGDYHGKHDPPKNARGRQVSIDYQGEPEPEKILGEFGFSKGSSLYLSEVSMGSSEQNVSSHEGVVTQNKETPTRRNQSVQTDLSVSQDEVLRKHHKSEFEVLSPTKKPDPSAKPAIKLDFNPTNHKSPQGQHHHSAPLSPTKHEAHSDQHEQDDDEYEDRPVKKVQEVLAPIKKENSGEIKPKIKHSDDLRTRAIKKSVSAKKIEREDSDEWQQQYKPSGSANNSSNSSSFSLGSRESVGSTGYYSFASGEATRSGDITLEEKIAKYVASGENLVQKPSQMQEDDEDDDAEEKLSRFGSMRFSEKFN